MIVLCGRKGLFCRWHRTPPGGPMNHRHKTVSASEPLLDKLLQLTQSVTLYKANRQLWDHLGSFQAWIAAPNRTLIKLPAFSDGEKLFGLISPACKSSH
jgi:hypothetical protein